MAAKKKSSPAFLEKKTGERYASKSAMKKHEKSEPKSQAKKEASKKFVPFKKGK